MDSPTKMRGDSVNPPPNSQGSFSPEQTIPTSLKRYYWCDICKAMQEDIIDDNTILQLPSDFVPLDLLSNNDNDNTFDFAESSTATTTTPYSSLLLLSPITNSIQNNLTLSPLNQSEQSTFNISSPPSNFSLFSNSTEEWNFVCDNFSPLFNFDCEVSLNDDFIQQILNPNFEEPSQNSNNNSNNSSNNNNNLLTGK